MMKFSCTLILIQIKIARSNLTMMGKMTNWWIHWVSLWIVWIAALLKIKSSINSPRRMLHSATNLMTILKINFINIWLMHFLKVIICTKLKSQNTYSKYARDIYNSWLKLTTNRTPTKLRSLIHLTTVRN